MQAQANNSRLCQRYNELEILCPIELILTSKIISFMFIVARRICSQQGQCVFLPADLK